ncbi:hypothetical protein DPMN_090728 [Dreissena polymorpha]|uniref:Uncharacterized protein n=1 Tax=Dreissena polymorpha TaxID=45954 RepID=A0A9D4L0A9_DREPO|nr:hypothetical protein DPMN_090728 [Dreissena polymorpha]
MKQDFHVLFHAQLAKNKPLKERWEEIDNTHIELIAQFEKKEGEMKERWEKTVHEFAAENKEIEEAWKDLADQDKECNEVLKSDTLSEKERNDIELEKEQLEEAKSLLKLEEQKIATKQRKVLDSIETEMERWEKYKHEETDRISEMKEELAKECNSLEVDQLMSKIHDKESNIQGMVTDLKRQEITVLEFEKEIEEKQKKFIEEKEELFREKQELNDKQCKAVIKLEQEIIAINDELESLDVKLSEELKEIQEERERYTDVRPHVSNVRECFYTLYLLQSFVHCILYILCY